MSDTCSAWLGKALLLTVVMWLGPHQPACKAVLVAPVRFRSVQDFEALEAASETASRQTSAAPARLSFLGSVLNSNAPSAVTNFTAFLQAGSSNFSPGSSDYANIYVPLDQLDSWSQTIGPDEMADHTYEGSFTYAYQRNSDMVTCSLIRLDWQLREVALTAQDAVHPLHVPPQRWRPRTLSEDGAPFYSCTGRILALNWDCHMRWGVTTKCYYNVTANQVQAHWSVVNLGPIGAAGSGDGGRGHSFIVHQRGQAAPVVQRFGDVSGMHPQLV